MKTYQIILFDIISKTTEKVKNFKRTEKELKNELYKLQLGYCEKGDKKPIVLNEQVKSNNETYNCLVAHSEVDYCYLSVLNKTS